jgi:hypothetical protein
MGSPPMLRELHSLHRMDTFRSGHLRSRHQNQPPNHPLRRPRNPHRRRTQSLHPRLLRLERFVADREPDRVGAVFGWDWVVVYEVCDETCGRARACLTSLATPANPRLVQPRTQGWSVSRNLKIPT